MLLSVVLALRIFLQDHDQAADPAMEPAIETVMDEPATAAAPTTTSDGDLVLDLFNPSEASLNSQLNESALKARLEDTVTLSFILRRCNDLTPQDYDDTYRALALYTQRMNPGMAAAKLQSTLTNAVEAGSASYGLIYSRLSCDLPQLATAKAQLAAWREEMLNQLPR